MTNTWYKSKIKITSAGIVAVNIRAAIEAEMFQDLPKYSHIDVSLSSDIREWFDNVLNPWFGELSRGLTVDNNLNELINSSYTDNINRIITSLFVANSYYQVQAESNYLSSSLKNVSLYKAGLCEQLAKTIVYAYEEALKQFGSNIQGKTVKTTVAANYIDTPEPFNWTGNVLVNNIHYEKVRVMESNNQETQQPECKTQYLPWVFTAAFGVIAWTAAASKNKK